MTDFHFTHGPSNRAYRAWRSMISQCYSPRSAGYDAVGGRGIGMCQPWRKDFQNFLDEMGMPDPGQKLVRKNLDGPFNKENCEWQ